MLLGFTIICLFSLTIASAFHKYPFVFLLDVGNEELKKFNTSQIKVSVPGGSLALKYPATSEGNIIGHVRVTGIDFGTELKANIVEGGPGFRYVVIVFTGAPGMQYDATVTIQSLEEEFTRAGTKLEDNIYKVNEDVNDSSEDVDDSQENPGGDKSNDIQQMNTNTFKYTAYKEIVENENNVNADSDDETESENEDDLNSNDDEISQTISGAYRKLENDDVVLSENTSNNDYAERKTQNEDINVEYENEVKENSISDNQYISDIPIERGRFSNYIFIPKFRGFYSLPPGYYASESR
ncbi:unnamed protein product [Leptosia nina]|uniref:Uncharacterized protein n=1 Tax=Leptosia nina TaxID=320188 RepID=A0AAV1IXD6_9NEOP